MEIKMRTLPDSQKDDWSIKVAESAKKTSDYCLLTCDRKPAIFYDSYSKKLLPPKRQNPGNRMTQSHLPRTGRGVVEAPGKVSHTAILDFGPAFSKEEAGFFAFTILLNPLP